MINRTIAIVLTIVGVALLAVAIWRIAVGVNPPPTSGSPTSGPSTSGPSTSGPSTSALSKITLRLKWVHQGQFAGFYSAQVLGFYRDEGIDVDIRPGGQEMNAVRLVASGNDDIGVWGADQIMIGRSQGIGIMAVAAIYQDTAACYMVKDDSPIKTFKDIEGKLVGTQIGTDHETIYNALMSINGVDKSKVRERNVSFDLTLFLSGQVDVWPSYIVNEPYVASKNGIKVRLLQPKDNGLRFYGDTVFCTNAYAKKNPELLKRFLRATAKGWQYALDHPNEAAEHCLAYDKFLDKEHQMHMITASESLIRPSPNEFLLMTDDRWMQIHNILKGQKLLDRDVSVSEMYTNEYLAK